MKMNLGKSGGKTSCVVSWQQSSYAHHDASHLCKHIFNDKLCSVGRVGPACSSRNLVGALVATCSGASEMPLPAGKGLKNMWHQVFEVPTPLSLSLSLSTFVSTLFDLQEAKKQTFESKAYSSKCVSKQSKPM